MRRAAMILALAAATAGPGEAQAPGADATMFRAGTDVQAAVAAIARAIKPGDDAVNRDLIGYAPFPATIEYWQKPKQPASHTREAEYVTVLAGAGTLVSGGTLVDPRPWYGTTLGGARIAGGTTRRLAPGDVFIVPEGTPHWFGIDGPRLVLLTMKLPRPAVR